MRQDGAEPFREPPRQQALSRELRGPLESCGLAEVSPLVLATYQHAQLLSRTGLDGDQL